MGEGLVFSISNMNCNQPGICDDSYAGFCYENFVCRKMLDSDSGNRDRDIRCAVIDAAEKEITTVQYLCSRESDGLG